MYQLVVDGKSLKTSWSDTLPHSVTADIPLALDEEPPTTDNADLPPPPACQSAPSDVGRTKKTEIDDSLQPSNRDVCPSERVIRTITLKQPTHVRILDFGVDAGGGRTSSASETVDGSRRGDRTANVVTSGLKRSVNERDENTDVAIKKPKTGESEVT